MTTDQLTRKGARDLTSAIDRVAECVQHNHTILGIDPKIAMDFAYRCDLISDDLVSGGAAPAVYDPAGCPGAATADCTGFDGTPGDPDSEIIIYYYEDPPPAVVVSGCEAGGGTFTLY